MGIFGRVAVAAAVGTGLLVVGGCGSAGMPDHPSGNDGSGAGSTHPSSRSSSAPYASVNSPVLAFRLRLTAGERLEHSGPSTTAPGALPAGGAQHGATASPGSSASAGCGNGPSDSAELERDGEYLATFEVDPPPCEPDQPRSENGRRPLFHSTDDMTEDQRARTHTFPLPGGTAVAFQQPYVECTNSCGNWSEPVVLVTPDVRANPAYPTLVVRSDKAALDLDDMEHLVTDQLVLPAPASPSLTTSPTTSAP